MSYSTDFYTFYNSIYKTKTSMNVATYVVSDLGVAIFHCFHGYLEFLSAPRQVQDVWL